LVVDSYYFSDSPNKVQTSGRPLYFYIYMLACCIYREIMFAAGESKSVIRFQIGAAKLVEALPDCPQGMLWLCTRSPRLRLGQRLLPRVWFL